MKFCYMCEHAILSNPKLLYCTVKGKYLRHYHPACEKFERG